MLGNIIPNLLYYFVSFPNSVDPDEMLQYAEFHPGLQCLEKYKFRGFPYTNGEQSISNNRRNFVEVHERTRLG